MNKLYNNIKIMILNEILCFKFLSFKKSSMVCVMLRVLRPSVFLRKINAAKSNCCF